MQNPESTLIDPRDCHAWLKDRERPFLLTLRDAGDELIKRGLPLSRQIFRGPISGKPQGIFTGEGLYDMSCAALELGMRERYGATAEIVWAISRNQVRSVSRKAGHDAFDNPYPDDSIPLHAWLRFGGTDGITYFEDFLYKQVDFRVPSLLIEPVKEEQKRYHYGQAPEIINIDLQSMYEIYADPALVEIWTRKIPQLVEILRG